MNLISSYEKNEEEEEEIACKYAIFPRSKSTKPKVDSLSPSSLPTTVPA
jgi:hypothetical protein